MIYALALAGLAAVAMAAPMKMTGDNKYGIYPSYKPYGTCGPYGLAVDEPAKTNQLEPPKIRLLSRRDPMKMGEDSNYSKYSGYNPYSDYGKYASEVEEAVAKAGMNDHIKRVPMKMGEDSNYSKYSGYNPYSDYGKYASVVDGSAAKEAEKRDAKEMAADGTYGKYGKYITYGNYPKSGEASAPELKLTPHVEKLAEAAQKKRHLMVMSASMQEEAEEASMAKEEAKRSVNYPDPSEMGGGSNDQLRDDNWYGKYNPYTKYSDYNWYPSAEAEAAAKGEEAKREMGKTM